VEENTENSVMNKSTEMSTTFSRNISKTLIALIPRYKNNKNDSISMIIGSILQEHRLFTTRETLSQKYSQGLNSGNDNGNR
jgi:RNase adaptor protein for sRNA GlmZ degradation